MSFESRPDGGGATVGDHDVVEIENLDDRARREGITAALEFQISRNLLGSQQGSMSILTGAFVEDPLAVQNEHLAELSC